MPNSSVIWTTNSRFSGVIVFLTAAAFLISGCNRRAPVCASLAVGILLIPNAEIVESLFGAFPVLSLLCFALARRFLFLIVSPDLAKVHGLGRKYDLALLLIFAMIVALGIKLVGTLLMGALTIIPAAVAKNVSRSVRGYVILSALLGGAISVGGMWMADALRLLPGPSIILFGVGLFLLSLAIGRNQTA